MCPMGRRAYAVLVLLDLYDVAVGKRPLDNIRLVTHAPHVFGLLDCGPELIEGGELDEMPHMGKRCLNDGALNDFIRGCDRLLSGSHPDYSDVDH